MDDNRTNCQYLCRQNCHLALQPKQLQQSIIALITLMNVQSQLLPPLLQTVETSDHIVEVRKFHFKFVFVYLNLCWSLHNTISSQQLCYEMRVSELPTVTSECLGSFENSVIVLLGVFGMEGQRICCSHCRLSNHPAL